LLIPDLPVEEAEPVARAAADAGLALPLFAAPTTEPERLTRTAASATGFLYVVGRVGVTGARTEIDGAQATEVDRVRAAAGDLPIGVGFGISDRAQVAALDGRAELAISGTAFVRAIHGDGDPDDEAAASRAARLVHDLRGPAAVSASPTLREQPLER
ncbi:MAG: tryptophan synthase subunit alpha, partial [Planctomycetota bacterium]